MNRFHNYFDHFSKVDKVVFKVMLAVIVYMFLLLFTSCAAVKRESSESTSSTEKVEEKKESTTTTETSKGIRDTIIVAIPESDNEEVMRMFESLLKQLNTSKSSGDNSYQLYYDEQLKQLRAAIEVGETSNTEKETTSESNTEKTFEQQVDEYVKKIVIPWWAYIIAAIFIWPYIKPIVMMLLGPTSLLSGFSSLTKPKE